MTDSIHETDPSIVIPKWTLFSICYDRGEQWNYEFRTNIFYYGLHNHQLPICEKVPKQNWNMAS